MAKVTYTDHDGAADQVTVFGFTFKDGKETEVSDDAAIRLMGNRFFKVSAPKAAIPTKKADDGALKAVHIAGGRFVIKQDGETIKEGLNKSDADAFNALSDEDKAEYVK